MQTDKRFHVSLSYDADVDAAYLTLKRSAVAESEEVRPGIILDFDSAEQIVGVEILRFTKRFRARGATSKSAGAIAGTPLKRRAS